MIKNYEARNVLKYLPLSILINFARGFFILFKRADSSALSGTIKALVWNLVNMGNTLKERKLVQKSRKFEDKYLFEAIFDRRNIITIYNEIFKRDNIKD